MEIVTKSCENCYSKKKNKITGYRQIKENTYKKFTSQMKIAPYNKKIKRKRNFNISEKHSTNKRS